MRVDAYCSQPHYVGHLAPIWQALPADARGTFFVSPSALAATVHYGVGDDAVPCGRLPRDRRGLSVLLVAGAADLAVRQARPAVLVEHGAGQQYAGVVHPSYAGGIGRDGVALFVVPNERVAAANAARYPNVPQVIAAPWVEHLTTVAAAYPMSTPSRVVFTRHWHCSLLPETIPAWKHHRGGIARWCAQHPHLGLLHAHPRGQVGGWYDDVPHARPVRYFDDVVRLGASVLVADNTSALYEWARLGRQVVVLNAPWYRRDVEHGLRFWTHATIGVQVDDPADLHAAVAAASDTRQTARQAALAADVFPVVEGSAKVAADAVLAVLG